MVAAVHGAGVEGRIGRVEDGVRSPDGRRGANPNRKGKGYM